MRARIFALFLLLAPFLEAKSPDLTPQIVRTKMDQILRDHATYKAFNEELVERTFQNFLEELDPMKTYFLAAEVAPWATPSKQLTARALKGFSQGDFTSFYELHQTLLTAIERRAQIEDEIADLSLPQDVKSEEFKDMDWVPSTSDLASRILRIRALQLQAASRLGDETKEKFLLRLEKRRHLREAELAAGAPEEQRKVILSHILKAASRALDPHTNYFTPTEANEFLFQIQQRLFGIGAQLRDDLNGLTIVRMFEKSPALLSGKLKIGDRIIAVNSEAVVGLDLAEAVQLIRGPQDTPVSLTVIRESDEGEQQHVVDIIRNEVVFEESRLETHLEPFGNGVIAHLKLFSFYQDTQFSSASDIRKALQEIKREHTLKGVLLDLRNNGGGLISQAVGVTGLFIHKGVVVSVKDHAGHEHHLREVDGKPEWEGPLIVLINRASASAAEIVAAALQDYGRALIVGDAHSFGKGTFQNFTLDAAGDLKVNPEGEFKVTRGRYYTVSGRSPQLVGVSSDLVVPGILAELDIGEEFAKFPLGNDEIAPHFEDDLSDLPPMVRLQLGPLYRYDLQKRLTHLEPYLTTLRDNSQMRIHSNAAYQNFLDELAKKNFDSSSIEVFDQGDLQLVEAFNILKDLLYLLVSEEQLAS